MSPFPFVLFKKQIKERTWKLLPVNSCPSDERLQEKPRFLKRGFLIAIILGIIHLITY